MNRPKTFLSLLVLFSLFVAHTTIYAAPAFTEQFNRDLSLSPFTWSSTSSTASGTSNVADAQAGDGRALKLSIAAGQAPFPGAGSNLQSKELHHYGTYETRLKTADCAANEGVINGFFTFQNGGDSNANGLPDNSEIDFEWLCAQPEVIFMTLWTDYNGATDESRRVYREVNLATGQINYTRYATTFGGAYTDLSSSPTENQPTTIQAIPGYDSSAAYYEYGFTWTETSVTWW
ncbi:MAG TPA: glycoside hydrolase family 16 protein, partial [Herpetosiphonaceae bacterium]|nr:glycoside hydrolase family 16 protein [Herpetosiphonaceae bacterium]